jgi:hypothetical protein
MKLRFPLQISYRPHHPLDRIGAKVRGGAVARFALRIDVEADAPFVGDYKIELRRLAYDGGIVPQPPALYFIRDCGNSLVPNLFVDDRCQMNGNRRHDTPENQRFDGCKHGRKRRFRVARPSTVQTSVPDSGAERVDRHPFRLNRIHMSFQKQRSRTGRAGQYADHIPPSALYLLLDSFQSQPHEEAGYVIGDRLFARAAGKARVHAGDGYQLPEHLDDAIFVNVHASQPPA